MKYSLLNKQSHILDQLIHYIDQYKILISVSQGQTLLYLKIVKMFFINMPILQNGLID